MKTEAKKIENTRVLTPAEIAKVVGAGPRSFNIC
jgi:hypothetical protein